jgi:hypothetical protein
MILKDIIEQQVTPYQLGVARSILSFNSIKDQATHEALLKSYRYIIEMADDPYQLGIAKSILSFNSTKGPADREALLKYYRSTIERADDQQEERERTYTSKGDDNSLDEILDDPRRGQADPINKGDY